MGSAGQRGLSGGHGQTGIVAGQGSIRYRWREIDATSLAGPDDWAHPGLAVDRDGSIVTFDQQGGAIARLSASGELLSQVPVDASLVHGIGLDEGKGITWLADPGTRSRVVDGRLERSMDPGRVVGVSMEGTVRLVLDAPPDQGDSVYRPTSLAVAPDGSLWVADGYGAGRVHRFGANGRQVRNIDGPPSGRFDCPHAVVIDPRGGEPRLLVADRENGLVHVFDLAGTFLCSFGGGQLGRPAGLAIAGQLLVVAELQSRLALFDPHDTLIGYVGDGAPVWREPGWPNRVHGDDIVRRQPLPAGGFVSPHAVAATPDGRVYVAEWLLGGRIVALDPL